MAARTPLIIGAGPAGLTAALALAKQGVTPRLFEMTGHVGGLARTPRKGDWRVDPGGHRFFTRSEAVQDLWRSLLPPEQWISVPRRSAMLVDGHHVPYPLVGSKLLTQMGPASALRGLSSLWWSRLANGPTPPADSASFHRWGTYHFGRYWYEMFFDGYVRKTWLVDPSELSSDWARQRIKPIAWQQRTRRTGEQDVFQYPRLGPGQLWEAAAAALAETGVVPRMNSHVDTVSFDGTNWTIEFHNGETAVGDAVFSSMPLKQLVGALDPAPPRHIRASAAALLHRGLITVAVALRKRFDIPYNWVYTPGKDLRVGRIQNYGRWSSALAPEGWDGTYLGLEYFIGPGGELRPSSDEELSSLVEADLRVLGMDVADVEHVMIVRSEFAYPISDPVQARSVARVRTYLRRHHPSLYPIGRNGMHRYDNQDHAMLSAMRSVDGYLGEDVDPWQVNTDTRYHESGLVKP